MHAGPQHEARRATNGAASVVAGQPHSFARQLVKIWRLDRLLANGGSAASSDIRNSGHTRTSGGPGGQVEEIRVIGMRRAIARKMQIAPRLAPVTLNKTPGKVENKNPPVSVATDAPGNENATMTT